MRGTKTRATATCGGLLLGLAVLTACGPTTATMATNTVAPAATGTRAAAPAPTGTQAVIGSPAIAGTPRPTTAATPGAATSTRPGAATPGASPVARPGTPATPGSPTRRAQPGQAFRNLQALDSFRQQWTFSGFAVVGNRGDLRAVYEHNGDDVHGTLTSGGNTVFEAYRIDGTIYVTNLVGGGFASVEASNPLAGPAQAFFALPETILTGLTPASANYRPTGSETVEGRPATEYTDTVELANLGFIDPSLQGQRGTAPTTLTITNDRSILVGTEAEFKTGGGDTVARARLNVTDIGQVGPITPPR